jgi:hypothetical protein
VGPEKACRDADGQSGTSGNQGPGLKSIKPGGKVVGRLTIIEQWTHAPTP